MKPVRTLLMAVIATMGGCLDDVVVAPTAEDIDAENLEGRSIQSEQSVVSTVRWPTLEEPGGTFVVVGYNDTAELREKWLAGADEPWDGTSIAGWAWSEDGGESWIRSVLPVPENVGALRSDPWLAKGPPTIDGDLRVYYAFLGTTLENPSGGLRYMVLGESLNGGLHFSDVAISLDTQAAGVERACRRGFDRETIDVNRTTGELYVSYNNTLARPCAGYADCAFGCDWTVQFLSPCPGTPNDWWRLNSHVQVDETGRAFVVTEEKDTAPGSDIYKLCAYELLPNPAGELRWLPCGVLRVARARDERHPAFGDSTWRRGPEFSFDIDGRTLVVAYVDTVDVDNVDVDHVFVTTNPRGCDPDDWTDPVEITPGKKEYQLQPVVSAEGPVVGVSYYESVTEPGENPGDSDVVRVFGARLDGGPDLWTLSDEMYSPCPTPAGYFGDYMGMASVGTRELATTFFTAWADARDGCDRQESLYETWHQHTYGQEW